MLYRIRVERDCLRADLYHRETLEETMEFLQTVTDSAIRNRRSQLLISVYSSKALFKIKPLFDRFGRRLKRASFRMALLSDSEELHMSHQYIEILARRYGSKVKSFREEGAALRWLKSDA